MDCLAMYKEKMNPGKRRSIACLMLVLSIMFLANAGAQPADQYQIRWIGTYPDGNEKNNPGFGDRVSRLVFGQKAPEVLKPFNVAALNPERFWILDQGAGGVFEVKNEQEAMMRSMKKADWDFSSLVGICLTSGGDLLFTDSRLNHVFRMGDNYLQVFGDTLILNQPTGIACNRNTGDIWVTETGSHQILRFNREGKMISKIGGRGTGPGLFNFPTFIWIDESGHIYVVDSMNYRLQIFDRDGNFIHSFGQSGDATGDMARPKGVATDSEGHIYVADALFNAVQIFDREGSFLYSFGNQGQGDGEFWMPAGLFIDDQDHIYVADTYNARIQIFKLEKND